MADIKLIQTPDDADFVLKGNDLVVIEGLNNMPLLALFGGNMGYITSGPAVNGVENFDWWGNYVLNTNDPKVWFNSYLENLLDTIAITPINLDKIVQTIKKDLKFLDEFVDMDVNVYIPYVDTLNINIFMVEKFTNEENEFSFIWNSTGLEFGGSGDNGYVPPEPEPELTHFVFTTNEHILTTDHKHFITTN